jgi:hypothetical protein
MIELNRLDYRMGGSAAHAASARHLGIFLQKTKAHRSMGGRARGAKAGFAIGTGYMAAERDGDMTAT